MEQMQKERLFQQEYHRLYDKLYRYVAARVSSRPDAEDIVAEAIMEGYRTLHGFDEALGNLDQWMFGITRHRMLAHWKKAMAHVDLDEIQEVIADERAADLSKIADVQLRWRKIMDAIPTELHPLITLRFSDGLSYEEIAEATGKSPAATRQLFSRLFRKLRDEFPELNEALV